jgi:hypothetical protein
MGEYGCNIAAGAGGLYKARHGAVREAVTDTFLDLCKMLYAKTFRLVITRHAVPILRGIAKDFALRGYMKPLFDLYWQG